MRVRRGERGMAVATIVVLLILVALAIVMGRGFLQSGLGLDQRVVIETPLMWLDKAGTWRLAETLGGEDLVSLILEESHTCYMGDRSQRHSWGYGCGSCPACELRRTGYESYRRG